MTDAKLVDWYSWYHVEFRDGYKGPGVENLFGLVTEPFSSKTEYLDKLIDTYGTLLPGCKDHRNL